MIKIRNKRAILELLKDDVSFSKIVIADNLEKDSLTNRILQAALDAGVEMETLPIWKMPSSRSGQVKEVIIAYLAQQKTWHLKELVSGLSDKNQEPFFLLLNHVHLANNIGSIARSAYAAGVNGLVFQGSKDKFFNEETVHYSAGAIARIPHVKMNTHEILKELRSLNIKIYALDMNGKSCFEANLTGASAFLLGAEREGLSKDLAAKCDDAVSIPMKKGIDSLNVAISASIILYEKARQSKLI